MGEEVRHPQPPIDKEVDPEIIKRRHQLFEQYVLPFKNMIYKLCIKYSFESRFVEENYLEVMTNFYRRIETYNPERPIRTWLHICTKRHIWALENKRLQEIKKKNQDYDVHDLDDFLPDYNINSDDVSSNALGVDNYREFLSDDFLSVLDELKPCYKDAFILQESGYSLKEIVEIEYRKGSLKSKNIETVKSRLRIARQRLKENLTRDGKRISRKTDLNNDK